MYKIAILEYDHNNSGKLYAIKAIKEFLGLSLKDAKDWVESLPISLDNQTIDDVNFYRLHFRCDVVTISDNVYNTHMQNQEPDPETALALNWLEGLSDEEKRKIDLIGKWKNPILIASAS